MPSISLLTVNTFGVPLSLSGGRLLKLSREIQRLDHDLICLQEIQQTTYVKIVQHGLRAWPHLAWHANRWAPMGGLVTLSRYPIEHSEFVPFPNRGRWLGVGVSDWALRKGVLVARVTVGGQPVVVLNTHLQANYRGDWASQNQLAQIQLDQVLFVAELARAQQPDALVFLAGDFNFPRSTRLYDALLAGSGLTDPLRHDHRPTYVPFPLVPRRWALALDFALYRAPAATPLAVAADILPIEHHLGRFRFQRFLTDHAALSLTAHWQP